MPPFYVSPLVKGIKDRVEALIATSKCFTRSIYSPTPDYLRVDDKLYLGTNNGTLYIYDLEKVDGVLLYYFI